MAPATDDTLRQTAADLGLDFDTGQRLAPSARPKPSVVEQVKDELHAAARDPKYLRGDDPESPQLRRILRQGFEGVARHEGAADDELDLAPEQAVQLARQRDGVMPSDQWMTPELEERWSAELELEYYEILDVGTVRRDVAQGILDFYVEHRGRLGVSIDDTIAAIKEEYGRMLEPAVMRALENWAREAGL